MAKWEQLIAAREQIHLSQMEAAERVNVGLITYQRWENGKTKPQPQHWRRLHEAFGTILKHGEIMLSREVPSSEVAADTVELILEGSAVLISDASERVLDPFLSGPVIEYSSEEEPLVVSEEEINEPEAFIAANMTTHLWSLAFLDHPTCNDMRVSIRQAIEEFDTMNATNKNYQITRRDALCALATLPMITLGLNSPGKVIQLPQYGSALAQCAASIEACWSLCIGEASDRALAYRCVSKYLSVLVPIVQTSSQYRKEAAQLAGQYAVLKTKLSWHRKGLTEAIEFAREAVTYGAIAEDGPLQLSAYSKLSWAYFYDKKYRMALETALQAQHLLEHTKAPLPSSIQAGTYSTLALMQAKNRLETDVTLGKVSEIDPGNEMHAFMQFTRVDVPREVGMIQYYRGDQTRAMESLAKIIDPTTFAVKMSAGGPEIEVLNTMALSALKSKDRDMEKTIHLWTEVIEQSKALQSEWGFNEAVTTYELMEAVWPNEPRIAELHDHLIHWE